jgi:hypothetical protein
VGKLERNFSSDLSFLQPPIYTSFRPLVSERPLSPQVPLSTIASQTLVELLLTEMEIELHVIEAEVEVSVSESRLWVSQVHEKYIHGHEVSPFSSEWHWESIVSKGYVKEFLRFMDWFPPPQLKGPFTDILERCGDTTTLERCLGTALSVPRDGRIRLTFDLSWLWTYEQHIVRVLNEKRDEKQRTREAVLSKIESLRRFDKAMRELGDFCVFDSDPSNPGSDPVVYRLGPGNIRPIENPKNGSTEPSASQGLSYPIDPQHSCDQIAKLHRVIFCQGLSLARNVFWRHPYHLDPSHKPLTSLPYLAFDDYDPIGMATKLHLSCLRRGGSKLANPYFDIYKAFHITFYEKVEGLPLWTCPRSKSYEEWKKYEEWKIGYLHEKPGASVGKGQVFRQSAFTMLATAESLKRRSESNPPSTLNDQYWTILLLTPSNFFSKPEKKESGFDIDWKVENQLNKQAAELAYIVHALRRVAKRWTDLNEYIAGLLNEDFMEPDTYVALIFDDQKFTRSRLYFWVIGCLNEFVVSIEDNIRQWELFREARVPPFCGAKSGDETQDATPPHQSGSTELQRLEALAKEADGLCEALNNLRSQFQSQLETVKALRDGLFSASALNESRASTRLGQNVQLLTYVSIFYLPLAFCAALWTVPNITDGGTRKPLIITAVIIGFVTYIIVFNLENIAELLGGLYRGWRENLIEKMQNDPSEDWQRLGKNFEEFYPHNNCKKPSEWRIIGYQIRTWKGRIGKKTE